MGRKVFPIFGCSLASSRVKSIVFHQVEPFYIKQLLKMKLSHVQNNVPLTVLKSVKIGAGAIKIWTIERSELTGFS